MQGVAASKSVIMAAVRKRKLSIGDRSFYVTVFQKDVGQVRSQRDSTMLANKSVEFHLPVDFAAQGPPRWSSGFSRPLRIEREITSAHGWHAFTRPPESSGAWQSIRRPRVGMFIAYKNMLTRSA